MEPCDVRLGIDDYPSVENAYQAAKCKHYDDRKQFRSCSPHQAKRMGRNIDIIDKWDQMKIAVMTQLLQQKFRQQKFKDQLLSTGNDVIVEFNNWNDKFWGVSIYDNIGSNVLGQILTNIREEIKNNTSQ